MKQQLDTLFDVLALVLLVCTMSFLPMFVCFIAGLTPVHAVIVTAAFDFLVWMTAGIVRRKDFRQ